jgi:hypothetical protein
MDVDQATELIGNDTNEKVTPQPGVHYTQLHMTHYSQIHRIIVSGSLGECDTSAHRISKCCRSYCCMKSYRGNEKHLLGPGLRARV